MAFSELHTRSLRVEEAEAGCVRVVLPFCILVFSDEVLGRVLMPPSEFTKSGTGDLIEECATC